MQGFSLGSGQGASFEVLVFGYAYPEQTDFWDGNWLRARLKAKTEGFRADYPLFVRAEEVEGFLDQLEPLYGRLRGEAEFRTMESQLGISMAIADPLGHVKVEVEASNPLGSEACLRFDFQTDQTYLLPLLVELREVASAFPVRGA